MYQPLANPGGLVLGLATTIGLVLGAVCALVILIRMIRGR